MRPEDEKILDELVTDKDARVSRSRSAARGKRAGVMDEITNGPDYFTGDPETDAYAWFDQNTHYWRKPGSWDTIPRVDRLYIPGSLHAFIDGLPVVNISNLWPKGKPEFPLEDFEIPSPAQWFIMQDGSTSYIVDNEGFEYPRYCCELAGNWL